MHDILDMTLPQCEELYNGICENNDVQGSDVLEGNDALQYLLHNKL